MRCAWLVLLTLGAAGAGCGFSSHAPGDAGAEDAGAPPPSCTDPDGDGFGVGDGCRGTDCREGDPAAHDCVCDAEGLGTGCPCEDSVTPRVCYEGPAGTAGVGLCEVGLRTCRDGHWSSCEQQVLPAAESCDGVDQNCDGAIDDGVQTPCGTCGACVLHEYGVDGEAFSAQDPDLLAGDDGSLTVNPDGDLTGDWSLVLSGEEPCPPEWGPVELDAELPANTSVTVFVRAADTRPQLGANAWSTIISLPGDEPRAVLFPEGRRSWLLLEVRVRLEAFRHVSLPTVRRLTVGEAIASCTD